KRGNIISGRIHDNPIRIGGDVVWSIQGYPVTHSVGDVCAIQDVVGGFTGESEIVMTVLREGKIVELSNRN
nr:hypothetical protein [Desulfobacteraceae bacterium]